MSSKIARFPDRAQARENDPGAALNKELLLGFHVLDLFEHPSGMGSHVTARLPAAETMLYHLQSYGFNEVTPDHIHECDFELNPLTGDGGINQTLHIHTRIYLVRPEINCIVHTHAKHTAALSAIGSNLEMITQAAARLYNDCIYFEEKNGVALGKGPGQAMADALGDKHAMVLKNHGLLTVGRTVAEAVTLAITLEQQAEVQLLAMAAGKLDPQTDDECERTRAFLRSDDLMARSWGYMLRRLERERPEVFDL